MSAQLLARYKFENDLKDEVSEVLGTSINPVVFVDSLVAGSNKALKIDRQVLGGNGQCKINTNRQYFLGRDLTISFWTVGNILLDISNASNVILGHYDLDEPTSQFSFMLIGAGALQVQSEVYVGGEVRIPLNCDFYILDMLETLGIFPDMDWTVPLLWVFTFEHSVGEYGECKLRLRRGETTVTKIASDEEYIFTPPYGNELYLDTINANFEISPIITSLADYSIDDLRIYNGVVSEEQLLDIYSGETSEEPPSEEPPSEEPPPEEPPPEVPPQAPSKYGTILRSFIYETTSEAPIKSVLLPGVLRNTIIRN